MKRTRTILATAVIVLLSSCTDNTLMHTHNKVSSDGWDCRDTMLYVIPYIESDCCYMGELELRSCKIFPYRKLWVCIETVTERDRVLKKDTVCIDFTDNADSWRSNGINVISASTDIDPIRLREGMQGTIRVYHLMKQETIPNILSVGIHLHR